MLNTQSMPSEFSAPSITIKNPLVDYKAIVEQHVRCESIITLEVAINNFRIIAKETQNMIWQLLFANKKVEHNHLKAGELLVAYRYDANTYGPIEYNSWIVIVRSELLKRHMYTFWDTQIVGRRLGPIYTQDCFMNDGRLPVPEEFYSNNALVLLSRVDGETMQPIVTVFESVMTEDELTDFEAIIGFEAPLLDYERLMRERVRVDFIVSEDILLANYKKISTAARNMVWTLLFIKTTEKQQNEQKAADLMEANKRDACIYEPWEYNEWIVRLRDKVIEKRMLRFWGSQVVRRQLGPCSGKDCDIFLSREFPPVEKFYKLSEQHDDEPIVIA